MTVERQPARHAAPARKRVPDVVREHPALTACLIGVLATLALALAEGTKPFYFDSGGYWNLSETFTASGHFSFLDYQDPLRGYALPLILWALRNLSEVLTSNQSLMVRGFNAMTFALIGTVLAPALATVAWPRVRWGVGRRLALTALILAFWSGYLSFPMSDFPALAAALVALVAIARATSPLWLLMAGLSAGLALNIRPAYVLLPPLLLGLLAWSWIAGGRLRPRSFARAAACALALLAGFAIVSVPQAVSQHEHYGGYDPVPGSSDLKKIQYTLGLKLQRYDTYVGGPPRMEYVEGHTGSIVASLDNGVVDNTGEYLRIVVYHPITMAGVLLRHLVNGLDQRYTTPFVETLESDRTGADAAWHVLLRVLGFSIVFLALVRVAWPTARHSLGPARWRYPAVLLAVPLGSVPSAMEARFMLPAFLLASTVVIAPGWRQALSEWWGSPVRGRTLALIFSASAAYAVVVWVVVEAATDSLRLS